MSYSWSARCHTLIDERKLCAQIEVTSWRQTKLFFFSFFSLSILCWLLVQMKTNASLIFFYYLYFRIAFSANKCVQCKHQNNRIKWLGLHGWMVILHVWLCLHMRLVAVGLCDLSFFVGDQTLKMESLFKGSSVFSGFFLHPVVAKCASDHGSDGGVSAFQDTCAFVSLQKKKKKDRQ